MDSMREIRRGMLLLVNWLKDKFSLDNCKHLVSRSWIIRNSACANFILDRSTHYSFSLNFVFFIIILSLISCLATVFSFSFPVQTLPNDYTLEFLFELNRILREYFLILSYIYLSKLISFFLYWSDCEWVRPSTIGFFYLLPTLPWGKQSNGSSSSSYCFS